MAVALDPKTKKYYAHFQYKDQTGKLHQRKKRGFSTKREAKAWEHGERERINRNVFDFQTLAKTYFATLEVSRATADLRNRRLAKYMSDLLLMDVRDISKPVMNEWRSWLAKQPISSTTKNNILTLCKSIFKFGFLSYGFEDPSAILRPFKKAASEIKTMEVWSIDEFNQFMASVRQPVYRALFRLLFWTGMRRGEALALTKSDILPDGSISISKSFRRRIDGIGSTKTASSVRTISLDDETFRMLLEVCERTDGDFIFGGFQPLSTQSVSDVFNVAIKRSGVKKIRIHDLRHSHASILLNDSSISIAAVSKRLGHSNVSTTLSVYTHVIDNATRELNDKISEIAKSKAK